MTVTLNQAARGEFTRYLASTMPHKAFAMSPNGGCGWRSGRTSKSVVNSHDI